MFTRYRPRLLTFLGVELVAGSRLKVYAIHPADQTFAAARFADGWKLAAGVLPQPPDAVDRPGVGFVVLHQTARVDYLILGWWDRENELPTRIFVRDTGDWRVAGPSESFCVWDLRVIWWEREAYVNTVLAGRPDAVGAYLASATEGFA